MQLWIYCYCSFSIVKQIQETIKKTLPNESISSLCCFLTTPLSWRVWQLENKTRGVRSADCGTSAWLSDHLRSETQQPQTNGRLLKLRLPLSLPDQIFDEQLICSRSDVLFALWDWSLWRSSVIVCTEFKGNLRVMHTRCSGEHISHVSLVSFIKT